MTKKTPYEKAKANAQRRGASEAKAAKAARSFAARAAAKKR